MDLDSIDQPGLGGRLRGNDDAGHAAPGEGEDHGQDAGYSSELATERQLADQRPGAVRPGLLRAKQDRDGDRSIERCSGLAQVSRSEVYRDPARWEDQAAVPDRAAHPFAA